MLASVCGQAFAAVTAQVYAEPVEASGGETVIIPVMIKNNGGIMGFKITVEYDSAVLSSPSVGRGEITENGNFNNSIGVAEQGTFDVVWSGAEDSAGDGSIMKLAFASSMKSGDETKIRLNFSQPDTFNEQWEDVILECSEITVKCVEKSGLTDISEKAANSEQPSDEEIKNAVDIVLNEKEKENIDELEAGEAEDFVDRTNEVIGKLNSSEGEYFQSIEDLRAVYDKATAEGFVENSKNAVNSDIIDSIIKDALNETGAESVDKVAPEKQAEFVEKVESEIAQYVPDVEKISDKLTADDALDAIERLHEENADEAENGKKLPAPQSKNNAITGYVAIAAAVAAIVIVGVIVVYIKIKRNKKEEAKTDEKSV